MIVFDASGSMSGNQVLGIPNSRARIDEVRAALAQVLPTAAAHRRVGLITYGPGPYNQCNVKLDLKPTPDAAKLIMSAVNALGAGRQDAAHLSRRTGGGRAQLPQQAWGDRRGDRRRGDLRQIALRPGQAAPLAADQLTVHVIAFRYEGYSWTGGNSVVDLMCLANENNGLYTRANSEEDLVEALEKTLDCPMISQAGPPRIAR